MNENADKSLQFVACALCGKDDCVPRIVDFVPIPQGRLGYTIVRCRNCGLEYVNPRRLNGPRFSYHKVDPAGEAAYECRSRRHIYLRNIRRLQAQFAKSASIKLLDIGCGAGIFLNEAKAAGFDAQGVEVSPTLANYARANTGLPIHNASLAEVGFSEKSFDIVTLWDVIEHVQQPEIILQEIYRILRPEGVVAIRTGNSDFQIPKAKLLYALRPQGGPYLIPYEHLYHFSPVTLESMLKRVGFTTTAVYDGDTEYCSSGPKYLLMYLWNLMARAQRLVTKRPLANTMEVYAVKT